MKLNAVCVSIVLAIGQVTVQRELQATTLTFSLEGVFTLQGTYGSPLANSSINAKYANNYQTPVTGTLTYDPDSGAGSMSVAPFDWGGVPGFTLRDMTVQLIPQNAGAASGLMLGNMLYDWNSDVGIPASIVWDASGMLQAIDQGLSPGDTIAGVGALPASDGTYVPYSGGAYLNLGPSPIATTDWNTSNAPGCAPFDCNAVAPSGLLPLVIDTRWNENKSMIAGTDMYGVSGSPLMEGGYNQKNVNLDFTSMVLTEIDTESNILAYDISPVPVPPAVWMLGSGSFGLVGLARRKKLLTDGSMVR